MKAAFALFDGFSALDFAAVYEPLARLGCAWDTVAMTTDVYDSQGLHFYPTRVTSSLSGYGAVIVPGGPGALERLNRADFLAWLATACDAGSLAGVRDGVLLLAASGLARGRRAAAQPAWCERLSTYGALPVTGPLEIDGPFATASSPSAALELAETLAARLSADQRGQLKYKNADLHANGIPVTGAAAAALATNEPPARRAVMNRQTGETRVEVRLDIDGTGRHQIDTGLPFLDHMLAQVAVHGLFDLYIAAKGDLHIDPHHTLEDVALTLGSAFQQALGDRAGIVRMASADCPMDESLAWVAVDLSGRPYSVIQAEWHGPVIGNLPVSLIPHFLESFALNTRCNLHAAVRYGRDDHHQAEAIFKALGRALCAATRIDPRRAGQVPSSKGVLF